ncbi:MAG: cation diffusion facilitator family transporter [Dehalococcoidia bacterium]|nr:cation diffusion facilitator family transporter [Dehalococcoidia bacterium]
MAQGSGHRHEGHDHGEHGHEGHDHDAHEGHDHAGHVHDAHAGHDHDAHAGHDHAAHDHASHEGHDHGAHAGHDHDDHVGHDHHGHDHHGHGHGGHSHAHDLRGQSRKNLFIALVLITTYMIAEVVGGLISGSLALIADAAHMLTDAAAIATALFAMALAERAASTSRTYGYYRTEVLAALINTLVLWLLTAWIFYEAAERFRHHDAEIVGLPVLLVGAGGLLINIAAAWVLHRSSGHSLNVEGAFQHVLADLLGSLGVVISAVLIILFGWQLADPIASVAIGLLVLWSSWHLMLSVLAVLLEGTPERIDMYKLCGDIEDLDGITLIHDVHAWTISSGVESFSAHVLVDPSWTGDREALRARIMEIVHDDYGIGHATIQLEQSANSCTAEDHHVGHLEMRSQRA